MCVLNIFYRHSMTKKKFDKKENHLCIIFCFFFSFCSTEYSIRCVNSIENNRFYDEGEAKGKSNCDELI